MVERLPIIEILLPVDDDRKASVTWSGEVTEAEEVRVDGDKVQVVIGGVTYDEHNADLHWRRETI